MVFLENEETAFALIDADAFAVRYLSHELRGDREVVLQALKGTGLALEFASEELRAWPFLRGILFEQVLCWPKHWSMEWCWMIQLFGEVGTEK